jgi:hypothetical protein
MSELNLIVFTGQLNVLSYFMDQFIGYCKNRNIDTYVVDITSPESYNSKAFHDFSNRKNTIMFTFNNIGIKLMGVDGQNYWKYHDIPVFDQIVDHPRNYEDSLSDPGCDLYVFSLDKNHVDFIDYFFPKVRKCFFSPNGGTEVNASAAIKDRPIDVLYMGGCQNRIYSYPSISLFDDNGQDFYQTVISTIIDDPSLTAEDAIHLYLKNKGYRLTKEQLLEFCLCYEDPIEATVRRYFKLLGIKALDNAGICVDIYGGESWLDDDIKFSENIRLHNLIEPSEIMKKAGEAKISLCFVPWYKRGCSEKNFDSMLNGALCISDKSEYLLENYRDGENIIYFDLNNPEQMAADVKWLLEHEDVAASIAKRGYETAKAHDSWTIRFDNMIEIMKNVVVGQETSTE